MQKLSPAQRRDAAYKNSGGSYIMASEREMYHRFYENSLWSLRGSLWRHIVHRGEYENDNCRVSAKAELRRVIAMRQNGALTA